MRKIAKLLGILCIATAGILLPGNKAMAAMGDVKIGNSTFPDEEFQRQIKKYDLNSDGLLSKEERSSVKELDFKYWNIKSLRGVEFLPELESISCKYSDITYADFSHNRKLTSLYLGNYYLDQLDLSNNTKLKELSVDWRGTNANKKIDLSNHTELQYLDIDTKDLKSIDVRKNTKLTTLSVSGTFQSIDLSKNTKLEKLSLASEYLKTVDLKMNTNLNNLWIEAKTLESLNLNYNTYLTDLTLDAAKLKNLQLTKAKNLFDVRLANVAVEELDFSKHTYLAFLMCEGTKIKNLKLNSDQLTDLILEKNTGLEYLDLGHCERLRATYNTGEKKTYSSGIVTYKGGISEITIPASVKVINSVVIQVESLQKDAGTVTGAGVYNYGDVITINAKPKDECVFVGFYEGRMLFDKPIKENDTIIAKSQTYRLIAKEDMFLVADFKNLAPFEMEFGIDSSFCYGGVARVVISPMKGYDSLPEGSYQWYRGNTKIQGATGDTYMFKQSDIGQKISFEYTTKMGGKRRIYAPGVIEKLEGINAELLLSVKAASREGRADGQILGVNKEMEYSTSKDFKNKKTCPDTKMTVKAGTYYIRYAETATTKAGKTAVIKVPDGPSVTDVFNDLQKDAWYIDAVKYVYAKGIMNGVSGKKFMPMGVTNRAEFVTMLYNLAGAPTGNKSAGFKDVKTGAWYEQSVNWAYASQITSGLSKTKFGPDEKITRQQAAVMLYKYAAYKKLDTTGDKKALNKFPDKNKVESWAKTAFEWAVHQGVINGKIQGSNTILAPNDKITRAECAQMIKNMADRVKAKK